MEGVVVALRWWIHTKIMVSASLHHRHSHFIDTRSKHFIEVIKFALDFWTTHRCYIASRSPVVKNDFVYLSLAVESPQHLFIVFDCTTPCTRVVLFMFGKIGNKRKTKTSSRALFSKHSDPEPYLASTRTNFLCGAISYNGGGSVIASV